jgi:very-short-patch-repair endonuclease
LSKHKAPKALSEGEETFALHCKINKLLPEREYAFAPKRKWRFDFAFPVSKVAVEIEGGTWSGGRHSRGPGFEADCFKYSEAAALGWRVIRVTTEMVSSSLAIGFTLRALEVPIAKP